MSTSSPTCASGVVETYAYDAAGNRTSAAGRSFTYGTSNKLATCSGTACNPVFDADGRLTRVTLASGIWSYQYDADGRLTAACKASSCTTGIARLDLAYDAEGNRTRITETPASGTATMIELTYEGGRVVRETATTGATVITRAFTADEAGAIVRMAVTGDPVTLHNGTYLVTWNGHGDALALERLDPVTGTLTVANRFSYTTWGAPTLTLHNGYGDLGFRYRYVGQWGVAWDAYAGADLLAMRARHYSPELGRFLQPDPARAEDNPYAYTGNSPVTKVDPSGEIAWFAVAFVAFRIVAAAAPLVQRAVPYVQRALPTAQRVTPYVQRAAPVTQRAGPRGVSVLGHYPGYKDLAQSIGARYFNVPQHVWERMTPAQQWAANQKFLDRLAARGDTIILSTRASQARPGSWF